MNKDRGLKTVFLFLDVRAYISDLLRTDYIKYLSKRYRVVVFMHSSLVKQAVELNCEYYSNENIEYINFSEPKSRFWTIFDVFLRTEFIRIFNDNPAVQWRNKRVSNRLRLVLRRIACLFPHNLFQPSLFFFLEFIFFPGYRQFRKYRNLYHPSLVLTASPGMRPFDVYAILCAKRARIPSVAVNFGWDNLTVYPRHVRNPNYLICWNFMQKNDAQIFHHFLPEQIFVSGINRFDHYYFRTADKSMSRTAFLRDKGLDPSRKTILYASKTHGTFYKEFIRHFLKWQESGMFSEPLNLFVRIHPLDSMADYSEFLDAPHIHIERAGTIKQDDSERGQKIEMNQADMLNMKYTLQYCDICINISSTVAVEAMIFDKPVIIAGFVPEFSDIAFFYHFRPLIEHNAASVAYNMDEVRAHVERYLADPTIGREGRAKVVEYMVKPTDGFSYHRNVDFLDVILEREAAR